MGEGTPLFCYISLSRFPLFFFSFFLGEGGEMFQEPNWDERRRRVGFGIWDLGFGYCIGR